MWKWIVDICCLWLSRIPFPFFSNSILIFLWRNTLVPFPNCSGLSEAKAHKPRMWLKPGQWEQHTTTILGTSSGMGMWLKLTNQNYTRKCLKISGKDMLFTLVLLSWYNLNLELLVVTLATTWGQPAWERGQYTWKKWSYIEKKRQILDNLF